MDFPFTWILSQSAWELIMAGVGITYQSLKDKMHTWALSDSEIHSLVDEINSRLTSADADKNKIYEKLSESEFIQSLEIRIYKNQQNNVTQTHSGTGDNVAGDKTIVNRK